MARKKKFDVPENSEIFETASPEDVVLEEMPAPEAISETPAEAAPVFAPTEAEEAVEPAEATQLEAPPSEAEMTPKSGNATLNAATSDESAKEDDGKTHVSLSLPLEPFNRSFGSIERLRAAITSKQTLLKKALATDSLELQIEEDRVVFPWFTIQEEARSAEEVDAYTKLVFALAKKALTQTRVKSEEKLNPDERLGMRLYLINLGFLGDEYKSARAILMRNFSESSTYRKVASDFHMVMPEVHMEKKHE